MTELPPARPGPAELHVHRRGPGCLRRARPGRRAAVAVGETVILLQPPLPLVGVSIAMRRERQQNDSLGDG